MKIQPAGFVRTQVNKGYTIIEMLVVISIMVIVVSAAGLTFKAINDSRQTQDAANRIYNSLSSAQNKASTGQKTADCAATGLDGWLSVFDTASNRFGQVVKCGSTVTYSYTDTLPADVQVLVNPNKNILFQSTNRGVLHCDAGSNPVACSSPASAVTITVTRGSNVFTITVNQLGVVSFEKTS